MKTFFIILFLIFNFSFSLENSVISKMKIYSLDIPERNLKTSERVIEQDLRYIKVIYKKGKNNTYKLITNNNEIYENIFNIEIYIDAKDDLKESVRRYELSNEMIFIVYHNQNGYFPVHKNEYYLINQSKSKIYELLPNNINNLKEIHQHKLNKLSIIFCKYQYKIYLMPNSQCK